MTVRIRFAPSVSPRRPFIDLAALLGWSRRVSARLRQRQRLADLDDRMLRDIGISRANMTTETTKPWWTLLKS